MKFLIIFAGLLTGYTFIYAGLSHYGLATYSTTPAASAAATGG
jgi:hypothetical protein